MASRVEAGNLDRVLVCFRAAEREKRLLQIAGRDLRQFLSKQPARLGRHARAGEGQLRSLLLDGLDHLWVLVTDIRVHQLRCKIQIALSICIPEINALRPHHRDRIHLSLVGPGKERIFLVEIDDLLRG